MTDTKPLTPEAVALLRKFAAGGTRSLPSPILHELLDLGLLRVSHDLRKVYELTRAGRLLAQTLERVAEMEGRVDHNATRPDGKARTLEFASISKAVDHYGGPWVQRQEWVRQCDAIARDLDALDAANAELEQRRAELEKLTRYDYGPEPGGSLRSMCIVPDPAGRFLKLEDVSLLLCASRLVGCKR